MSQQKDGAEVALAEQPQDGKFELTDKQPVTEPLALVGRFELMDRSRIRPSKTNPRKTFIQSFIEELAQNIGVHGLAMPPLVRPAPPDPDYPGTDHEVVAGEQRYRATSVLKWVQIPVYIRDLTDQQALEIQVIENLKRKDLHPLEEAEGFDQLMKEYGYTADTLAEKVKHSKSTIYASLKLLALSPDARKAFYEGKITQSSALLIARIPSSKLQMQAVTEVGGNTQRDPLPARQASAHIQQHFMTKLKEAPFDTKSATLLPEAGSCTACPNRTGNSPELFHDVQGADVCTDTTCFAAKRHAWAELKIAKAKDNGLEVIVDAAAAKKIVPGSGSYVSDGYELLKDKCWSDPKQRSYAQIAKESGIKPVLVKNPQTGDAIEVIRKADLKEVIPASKSMSQQEKEAIQKAQFATKCRLRALDAISEKISDTGPCLEDWRYVAYIVLSGLDSNTLKKWVKYSGWDAGIAEWNGKAAMIQKIQELDAVALANLILRSALFSLTQASANYNVQTPQAFLDAAARHEVDFTAVESTIKAEDDATKAAKKKGAKKTPAPASEKVEVADSGKKKFPVAMPKKSLAKPVGKSSKSTPQKGKTTAAAKKTPAKPKTASTSTADSVASVPTPLMAPTPEQRNTALREGWNASQDAENPYPKIGDIRHDLWNVARARKERAPAGAECPTIGTIDADATAAWPFKTSEQIAKGQQQGRKT